MTEDTRHLPFAFRNIDSLYFDRLMARTRRHEGLRLVVYDDATGQPITKGDTLKGYPTIGYGRNLASRGISLATAALWLQEDLKEAWADVERAFPWTASDAINDARHSVLVEMCYNLGLTKLKGFKKMLAALERHDFQTAADEMLDSKWARQVGGRAKTLAAVMRTGRWE